MVKRRRRRVTIGKTSENPAKNPLNNYVAKYAAQFGATAKTHRDKTKYNRKVDRSAKADIIDV